MNARVLLHYTHPHKSYARASKRVSSVQLQKQIINSADNTSRLCTGLTVVGTHTGKRQPLRRTYRGKRMVLQFASDPLLVVQQRHQRGDVIQQFLVVHQELVCARLRNKNAQKLQKGLLLSLLLGAVEVVYYHRRSDVRSTTLADV